MGRRYDKEVATYIPDLLEFKFQGMLEDMDTRKKVAQLSYTDMEQLSFYILSPDNYYINLNSMYAFP